jgi:hypothetical protein
VSRYRKVEVRTYGDEKFCKLSRVLPSGQSLWIYLITGPHTTSVPGLFRAGRAALAEELGWSQEAFDKAFQEVFREGMAKADWNSRVVWIPNAIKHNAPENPNVVKGWATELDLIPECALKVEALDAIGKHLESMNPAFLEAFRGILDHVKPSVKGSRKGSAKPSGNGMANQEQEQEQEQEKDISREGDAPLTPKPPPPPPKNPDLTSAVERIVMAHPRSLGRKQRWGEATYSQKTAVLKAMQDEIDASGCSGAQALEMILARVELQAREVPPDRHQFFKDIERYFALHEYRLDPEHFNREDRNASNQGNRVGGGKTLGNRKADAAANALDNFFARIDAEAEGPRDGTGEDESEPGRGPGRGPSGVVLEGAR